MKDAEQTDSLSIAVFLCYARPVQPNGRLSRWAAFVF